MPRSRDATMPTRMRWFAGSLLFILCTACSPRGAHRSVPEDSRAPAAMSSTSFSAAPDAVSVLVAPPAAEQAPEGMLLVPAGSFTMGADEGGEADERPAHEVTVESFWLDVTEVTNAAYGACVAAGMCRPPDPKNAARNGFDDRAFRGANQPVSAVSWGDAVAYCAFRGKRLPTEAEWERAARGDDRRTYPWGEEPPTVEHGVFSSQVTADVGAHPRGAGPFGHLDLAGNVWEWTADHYDPLAYTRPNAREGRPGDCAEILRAQDKLRAEHREGFTGTNPIPTECERVLRGGAFNYPPRGLRVTNRVHHPARFRLVMSGLRCARDAASRRP